jgi:hypothetical protein
MSDVERRYHETWLGMAQPIEGLVVSVPVLVDAQCMQRLPVTEHHKLIALTGAESPRLTDVPRFLREVLGYPDGTFVTEFPEGLRLDVVEGQQTIVPTRGLLRRGPPPPKPEGLPDDSTPTSRAGENFVLLTWELPTGLDLDAKENVTGAWFYEPTAKFERLLRAARVPIGLLFNGDSVRLLYAPHGESTGHLTFRFKDLVTFGGRPLFDAMVMLLHARRLFGVLPEHQLPALLEQSRRRQANVATALDANRETLRGRLRSNPDLVNGQFVPLYFASWDEMRQAAGLFLQLNGDPRQAGNPQAAQQVAFFAASFP